LAGPPVNYRVPDKARATGYHPRMKLLLIPAIVILALSPREVGAATPAVPMISAAVAAPGRMYPDPAVSLVPTAVKVEDFPYLTEEYFVSGTAAGAPYQTRIIVRRPRDPKTFSGTVVAEAQHAGGRSLIFEWSRVSVLTRHHLFVEIVHSPANVATMKMFNAERYATLNIAMGQANEIIAQVGRLIKAKGGPFAAYDVPVFHGRDRDLHDSARLLVIRRNAIRASPWHPQRLRGRS